MSRRVLRSFTLALVGALPLGAAAGPLGPVAGAPAPTMKTLQQMEPRTPVGPDTTPGDADSAYKITQAGSYYLTGNVFGPGGKHGIEIAAVGVTLDLNGYTVQGVPSSLAGISVTSMFGVTIRNGHVNGFGSHGIDMGGTSGGLIEGVTVVGCSQQYTYGIKAGPGARVRSCGAYLNASGISLGAGAVAEGCEAHANNSVGFLLDQGSLTQGCSARENLTDGFYVAGGTMRGCVSSKNQFNGVRLSGGTLADSVVRENVRVGVVSLGSSIIVNNTIQSNGTADPATNPSVSASNWTQIEGNRIMGGGGVSLTGVENVVMRNTFLSITGAAVSGSTTYNAVAPVLTAAQVATSGNAMANVAP